MSGASEVRFSVASTPTGSVGLISTPNTSAQAGVSGTPTSRAVSQKPPPTTAAEITTPRVARKAAVQPRRFSSSRSTCMAPANSR